MGRPLKTGPEADRELKFKLRSCTLQRFHALKRADDTANRLFKRLIAGEEARQEYTDEKGILTVIDPKTGEQVKIFL